MRVQLQNITHAEISIPLDGGAFYPRIRAKIKPGDLSAIIPDDIYKANELYLASLAHNRIINIVDLGGYVEEETLAQGEAEIDVRLDSVESVLGGFKKVITVPANMATPLLASYPRGAKIALTARPTVINYLDANFSEGYQLNGWVFGAGITYEYSSYEGEKSLKIIIPKGFTGIIARRNIGVLAPSTSNSYMLINRMGIKNHTVNPSANIDIGAYTLTQSYFRNYNTYGNNMPSTTFGGTFSVFNEPDGEELEYRVSTSGTTAAQMEIHLIVAAIKSNTEGDVTPLQTSFYQGEVTVTNGSYAFVEKAKVGAFSSSAPTVSNGNISHPTIPMTVEIVVNSILSI